MAEDTPRAIGPVWIVQPGGGGAVPPSPEQPLPPDVEVWPNPPEGSVLPEHPIVLPPDVGIWPNPPEGSVLPEHPIVIPPDIQQPPEGAHPAHPIYIDAYPDNSLPPGIEKVGEPSFYQRKTLGINWEASFDPAKVVGVYAGAGDSDQLSLVRQVANDGTSSVTYPQDFEGRVTIRVAGINGYLEGSTTIK